MKLAVPKLLTVPCGFRPLSMYSIPTWRSLDFFDDFSEGGFRQEGRDFAKRIPKRDLTLQPLQEQKPHVKVV